MAILDKYIYDLFEEPFDWRKEWKDMPEFEHEDIRSKIQIIVHFRNEEDVQKFAKLIDQEITPFNKDASYTKSLWYPYMPIKHFTDKRYIDENQVDLFEDNKK